MFTPRTGEIAPDTSSEMMPNSCSAGWGAEGTSALLSGVRPLHSFEQLESKHALSRELLEQRAFARHCAPRGFPTQLPPRAAGNLHLLLPRQYWFIVGFSRGLCARFGPILHLNLDQSCFTHHLLPFDEQVRSK